MVYIPKYEKATRIPSIKPKQYVDTSNVDLSRRNVSVVQNVYCLFKIKLE